MGYLDGFGVTIGKWLGARSDSGRRVTSQYPEQTRPKPERFHGRHVLNRYDDGMEKCIGCELCAGVCPARCIYVRGADNDPEDPTSPGERYGFIYEINYLRCIHCDLCVEACPTEAITETKLFEFAFTNRSDAIYTKDELLVGDDGRPQRLPWENWDGGFDPAADTSGWMRATSSSGDEDFVGLVAWAGELGYGVRPAEGAVAEPVAAPDHDEHVGDEHAGDEHAGDEHAGDEHGADHDDDADHDDAAQGGAAHGEAAGTQGAGPVAGYFEASEDEAAAVPPERADAGTPTPTTDGDAGGDQPTDGPGSDPDAGKDDADEAADEDEDTDGGGSTAPDHGPGFFDAPDDPEPTEPPRRGLRFGRRRS